MAAPHCRIGRVTFKSGGATLTLLPSPSDESRRRCRQMVLEAIERAGDIGGFVFLAWDPSGGSSGCVDVSRSNIPSILVPDFVRNRLLAQRIESWTLEAVNDVWGG